MTIILLAVSFLLGGVLYRARGGWPSLPRPIEQMLFCSIIGYAAYAGGAAWWVCLIIYALSVGACLKGHGHTMNLPAPVDRSKLEGYELFTKWLIGRVPDYWYKVFAHGFGGFIVTAPLMFISPIAALSGWLKGAAYMIGWANFLPGWGIGKFRVDHQTAWGEFLTGGLIWSVVFLGGL